jgi:hypothetical protein
MATEENTIKSPIIAKSTRTWDIRGWENAWNWKASEDSDEIVYWTLFFTKHLAMLYRGSGEAAQLLATIKTNKDEAWEARITLPDLPDGSGRESIIMDNITGEGMANRWPVKVRTFSNRELHWEYVHLAIGDRDLRLEDPITKEEFGHANSNFLSFHGNVPEEAIEELVITGTAAEIMLAPLMHNDMSIAVDGPEGSY